MYLLVSFFNYHLSLKEYYSFISLIWSLTLRGVILDISVSVCVGVWVLAQIERGQFLLLVFLGPPTATSHVPSALSCISKTGIKSNPLWLGLTPVLCLGQGLGQWHQLGPSATCNTYMDSVIQL